ncbi:Immediate early response 3-interacting protein 1, partial [Quillaja saponaria]
KFSPFGFLSSKSRKGELQGKRVVSRLKNFGLGYFFIFPKMGFWTLMEGFLLFANALAILNEDRFLAPRRWTLAEVSGGARNSVKGQLIGLIYACQFLRLPLILFNIIFIVVKLFSG